MDDNIQFVNSLLEINRVRILGDIEKAIDLAMKTTEEFEISCEMCELISDLFFCLAANSPNETGENYQKAIHWLKNAININGANSQLHSKLGNLYWLGIVDYQSAEDEFHQAIELDPGNRRAYVGIAALYDSPDSNVTLGEAIKCLSIACKLEPDDPMSYARLGDLLYEDGNVSGAFIQWANALTCSKPLDEGFVTSIRNHLI